MTTQAPEAPAKRKRGTESVRDMLLSLAAVFAVVVPFWYLTSLNDDDQGRGSEIRVVETAPAVASLRQAVPGVPAPEGLPEGWRPTSANVEGPSLRIGYVTPDEAYAEYFAQGGSAAAQEQFLAEQTGQGERGAELQVGERTFEVWSNDAGATSLVLEDPEGAWTVVVGGVREDAGDEQLQALAASLQEPQQP